MTDGSPGVGACYARRKCVAWSSFLAWIMVTLFSWLSVGNLAHKFNDTPFEACFFPGLVNTVEHIKTLDVVQVFGPQPDASSYVFQRMSEMLYPILYYSPYSPAQLKPGDVYMLLPRDGIQRPSTLLFAAGDFRLLEVSP
jgi:hypothetical protein